MVDGCGLIHTKEDAQDRHDEREGEQVEQRREYVGNDTTCYVVAIGVDILTEELEKLSHRAVDWLITTVGSPPRIPSGQTRLPPIGE